MQHIKRNGLNCRIERSKLEDFAGILDINRNIYAGFDYMPGLYRFYLHEPNTTIFVAKVNEQIVGLDCVEIMDKNHCVILAGRVNEAFQRMGIQRDITLELAKWACDKLESPKTGLSAAFFNPKYYEYAKLVNTIIAQKWNVAAYKTSQFVLNTATSTLATQCQSATKPIKFNLHETVSTLTNNETMELLKKYGNFVVYFNSWRPRKIDPDNLRMIAHHSSVLFTLDNAQCGTNRTVTGVSFTNATPCLEEHTTRIDIYYYGAPKLIQWASHILEEFEQLLQICSSPNKKFNFVFHFPIDLDVETVTEFLQPMFGERFKEDVWALTTACVLKIQLEQMWQAQNSKL